MNDNNIDSEVWAGKLSVMELAGWSLFILSLLLLLADAKLQTGTKTIGIVLLISGSGLSAIGCYRRIYKKI